MIHDEKSSGTTIFKIMYADFNNNWQYPSMIESRETIVLMQSNSMTNITSKENLNNITDAQSKEHSDAQSKVHSNVSFKIIVFRLLRACEVLTKNDTVTRKSIYRS